MAGDEVVLELEVTGSDGSYHVDARSSVGGECAADTRLGWQDLGIDQQLDRLRIALLRSSATTRRIADPDERSIQRFGADLFDRLFADEVRVLYDTTRQHAAQNDLQIQLVLRIRPPELAALPWEFLYDARRDDYLSLSMPLVRYPEMLEPVRPLRVAPPLRILGMVARAVGHDVLDVEAEKAHLRRALSELIETGWVELSWVDGETWRDLQRSLNQRDWHVLHFIGHGAFDPVAGEGVFILPDEVRGNYSLRASQFARLLSPHHSLRLLMLNACESALGSTSDVYSSAAATLIRRGIPAVLAMQFEISDLAAIEFTRSFYQGAASGQPIDVAVRNARLAVSLSRPNSLEWGTPVLFLRQRDGQIFDLASTTAMPAPAPATPPPAPARASSPQTSSPQTSSPQTSSPRTGPPRQRTGPASPPVTTTSAPTRPRQGVPAPVRETTPAHRRPTAAGEAPSGRPPGKAPSGTETRWARLRGRRAVAAITAGLCLIAGLVVASVRLTSGGPDFGRPISVPANADWTSTRIAVRPWQVVSIRAQGEVGVETGLNTGPDGLAGRLQDPLAKIPSANYGALLARIGDGAPFAVGSEVRIRADAAGDLLLGANDLDSQDNTGFYTVEVALA